MTAAVSQAPTSVRPFLPQNVTDWLLNSGGSEGDNTSNLLLMRPPVSQRTGSGLTPTSSVDVNLIAVELGSVASSRAGSVVRFLQPPPVAENGGFGSVCGNAARSAASPSAACAAITPTGSEYGATTEDLDVGGFLEDEQHRHVVYQSAAFKLPPCRPAFAPSSAPPLGTQETALVMQLAASAHEEDRRSNVTAVSTLVGSVIAWPTTHLTGGASLASGASNSIQQVHKGSYEQEVHKVRSYIRELHPFVPLLSQDPDERAAATHHAATVIRPAPTLSTPSSVFNVLLPHDSTAPPGLFHQALASRCTRPSGLGLMLLLLDIHAPPPYVSAPLSMPIPSGPRRVQCSGYCGCW